MQKKFLFLLSVIAGAVFLFPTPTLALDQRCWEKPKCIEKRSQTMHFQDQRPEDGFVQNGETMKACGKSKTDENGKAIEVGFCLPVGATETKISFGGKTKFSDIADFIRYMYRYGIMAAGIIGVLMIILSGFQWSVSGGNSTIIEGAKKRISGALMGLTIAVLSYSILYFVNPNLVNFRLPSIWLINTIEEIGKYCTKESLKDKKLALFVEDVAHSQPVLDKVRDEKYGNATFTIESKDATCNKSYFVQDAQGLSCLGISCGYGKGQVCDTQVGECRPGVIAGTISNSNPTDVVGGAAGALFGDWVWDSGWFVNTTGWVINGTFNAADAIILLPVCQDGSYPSNFGGISSASESSMQNDSRKKTQKYLLPLSNPTEAIQNVTQECASHNGLKGFMLKVGFHELYIHKAGTERHYLGVKNNRAIDLGDDNSIKETLKKSSIDSLLIKPEHLLEGLILDIDAGQIKNGDEGVESKKYYDNLYQ